MLKKLVLIAALAMAAGSAFASDPPIPPPCPSQGCPAS